jgi:hypothetical protein
MDHYREPPDVMADFVFMSSLWNFSQELLSVSSIVRYCKRQEIYILPYLKSQ